MQKKKSEKIDLLGQFDFSIVKFHLNQNFRIKRLRLKHFKFDKKNPLTSRVVVTQPYLPCFSYRTQRETLKNFYLE